MREISAVEIRIVIGELESLLNARIDQIYGTEKGALLQFHISGAGRKLLQIKPPYYLAFTDSKQAQEAPTEFCMNMRKNLSGAKLIDISQYEFERIVIFTFSSAERNLQLIIELFSKGNIILCDQSMKILASQHNQQWSTRTIRPGSTYAFPTPRFSIFQSTSQQFSNQLRNSTRDSVVKALAMELGFGGLYAEELCRRTGTDKLQKPKDTSDGQVNALYTHANSLMREQAKPMLVLKDSEIADVIPFKLELYEDAGLKATDSFSITLGTLIDKQLPLVLSRYDKKIEAMNAIIAEQQAHLVSLKEGIKDNTLRADAIYSNYQQVKDTLEEINKIKDKENLHSALAKARKNPLVAEINEKEGTVTLDLT